MFAMFLFDLRDSLAEKVTSLTEHTRKKQIKSRKKS